MTKPIILDTNLWVYLYSKDPLNKSLQVRALVNQKFELIIVTTQILGELFNVLTRKQIIELKEAKQIISEIISSFLIIPIETPQVLQALEIHSRYHYSYWDSLIIATALISDCEFIYSEDMQNQQIIENQITIINPFI
ncbi:PIN domain-containing protein [Cyanothece sp. BG0011]|uniref:PIN domain-containing protein n=1 Tax=Cyanothece sp. BG0011 TaxID=2082950 RepID=UPI000D1E8F5A|nr:PIN domain-containing protein [Cyanothece sp. BG0011]